MNYKKAKLTGLLLLTLGLFALQAQEAVVASGGNASGSGGTVSYSVGQVVYTTPTGTGGTVAQGVQQPFEIWVVTGIDQAAAISLQCIAYPNPTTEFLTLDIAASTPLDLRVLSYQLFDIKGKLLENKKLEALQTRIDMSPYAPAAYLLKVTRSRQVSHQDIKTFTIIKK